MGKSTLERLEDGIVNCGTATMVSRELLYRRTQFRGDRFTAIIREAESILRRSIERWQLIGHAEQIVRVAPAAAEDPPVRAARVPAPLSNVAGHVIGVERTAALSRPDRLRSLPSEIAAGDDVRRKDRGERCSRPVIDRGQ